VPDFALAVVRGAVDGTAYALAGDSIALCTSGSFTIVGAAGSTTLSRGESVFVTADETRLTITGEGTLFVAGPNSTP
jgi:mannose-6-phosphate isomerase